MPAVTKDNSKHAARKRHVDAGSAARKRGEKKAADKKAPARETATTTRRRRFAREDDGMAAKTAAERAHAQADDVTTDSLQLFFNEARKYPLLTAAEEIELAQRIEKGDIEAKDRMINSNLRLV